MADCPSNRELQQDELRNICYSRKQELSKTDKAMSEE